MPGNFAEVLAQIREFIGCREVYFTNHAHEEMMDEAIAADDVLHALDNCELLENYPDHKRGQCCLVTGKALDGRPLHVVCGTEAPQLVIITVYEPKPPKWVNPRKRRESI
jgi:hypothetical protein